MANALFLVSTGRTGTTWLEHLFAEAGANARHEPGPLLIRHVSHAYASGHLSDENASKLLVRWRGATLNASGRPYVEASTLVYGLARPILETFPDAHVVQVVRDPLTYLRSAMNWGQYRFGGRVKNVAPFRRLARPHFDPIYDVAGRVRWVATGQFGRLCWAWTKMNQVMREQGEGNDRFTVLAYESLFDAEKGHTTIGQLLELVNLEVSKEDSERIRGTRVNENKPGNFPRWQEWSSDQLAMVIDACGREARHYGYDIAARVLRDRPEVEAKLSALRKPSG